MIKILKMKIMSFKLKRGRGKEYKSIDIFQNIFANIFICWMLGATSHAGGGGEDDCPNSSSCHEPHQVRHSPILHFVHSIYNSHNSIWFIWLFICICCRHHSLGLSRHHSLGLAIMPEVKKEFTDEEMKVCSSTL